MSMPRSSQPRSVHWPYWAGFLLASLAMAYLLYGQAFPRGGFMYDDKHSFEGLAHVTDLNSALLYIFSGDTGPLGRPLSLVSFLLNAPAWPDAPGDFFYVNTLLHLINGLLVAWLALLIARNFPKALPQAEWFAVLVAAIWMLHPVWTYVVLHAVQRMAILSTTFSLLGLIAYLKARAFLDRQPRHAMFLMLASLAVGTALAVLSKENGILLPLLAATLEWLLRSNSGSKLAPESSRTLAVLWRHWLVVLFWLPGLLLFGYMLHIWPGFDVTPGTRDFTAGQRLITESRVLWQYLFNLAMPRTLRISPFYDDYAISQDVLTPISTLAAIAAWLAVAFAGWHWRKRFPIFFFGIAWYLVGHSLESTGVPLEIYFEHRNYLPSIGVLICAVYLLWQLPTAIEKLRWAIAAGYLLLLTFILSQSTQLWGNLLVATELWEARQPLSARAVQYRAISLQEFGRYDAVPGIIWAGYERIPRDTGLAVQSVQVACYKLGPEAFHRHIDSIIPGLRTGVFSEAALSSLATMIKLLNQSGCPPLKDADINRMIDALLANPKFVGQGPSTARLYFYKAFLHLRAGEQALILQNLHKALQNNYDLGLILLIAQVSASASLYDDAIQILDNAALPANPILHATWKQRIAATRAEIAEAKAGKREFHLMNPSKVSEFAL